MDQSESMYGNSPQNMNANAPITNSPNNSPPGHVMQVQKSPVYQNVEAMQPVTNSMNIHSQNQQVWNMVSLHLIYFIILHFEINHSNTFILFLNIIKVFIKSYLLGRGD